MLKDWNEKKVKADQKLENENTQLKARIRNLEKELLQEANHNKELLPQYRESLEKLKSNSNLMR